MVVDNGDLSLSFLPQVGGRLISLRLGDDEVLWRNPAFLGPTLAPVTPHASWAAPDGSMASWANVGGSKTWPAPQGWSGPHEWPGPPDAVLDFGPYAVSVTTGADGWTDVRLTSPDDPRTGLRISRAFFIPPAGTAFSQVSTFTNCGDRPRRWSVWEVAQVDTSRGGRFVVDVASPADPLRLLDVVGVASWTYQDHAIGVPVQEVVGKLGFPEATGRISYARGDGVLLELTTERLADQPYPDGGCPVELWLQFPNDSPLEAFSGLHPQADLVEMELLSPLVDLEPGGTALLPITWRVTRS
ncbi:DUF4380 domain-containing protein [Acidothermaceae bacterium B102]|nr:DUF4380 domain-containing protein [Acidothermaceae bacterium B102]